MIGRTPASISAVRPLRHGVITDFETTEAMLRHFIGRVHQLALRPSAPGDVRALGHHRRRAARAGGGLPVGRRALGHADRGADGRRHRRRAADRRADRQRGGGHRRRHQRGGRDLARRDRGVALAAPRRLRLRRGGGELHPPPPPPGGGGDHLGGGEARGRRGAARQERDDLPGARARSGERPAARGAGHERRDARGAGAAGGRDHRRRSRTPSRTPRRSWPPTSPGAAFSWPAAARCCAASRSACSSRRTCRWRSPTIRSPAWCWARATRSRRSTCWSERRSSPVGPRRRGIRRDSERCRRC